MVRRTVKGGGTLFFCGNGGSAADAQHLATEYVVRYMRDRRAYPAVALTTDTSLLTAAGNDFGFDHIFARQVEALARRGDLLIIHSTSGNSPNVLRAAEAARAKGDAACWPSARGTAELFVRSPTFRSSFQRIEPTARRSCTCASNISSANSWSEPMNRPSRQSARWSPAARAASARATAELFAENGADVAIGYRSRHADADALVAESARAIRREGRRARRRTSRPAAARTS